LAALQQPVPGIDLLYLSLSFLARGAFSRRVLVHQSHQGRGRLGRTPPAAFGIEKGSRQVQILSPKVQVLTLLSAPDNANSAKRPVMAEVNRLGRTRAYNQAPASVQRSRQSDSSRRKTENVGQTLNQFQRT
jgi:hypothetical protein